MRRRGLVLFAFVLAILMVTPAFASDEKSDQEKAVVKSFKQFAADLISNYRAGKNELVEPWQLPPCMHMDFSEAFDRHMTLEQWDREHPYFRKARYEPSADYGIDVRKTDSLISPYLGVIEFDWIGHYSDCTNTREEARGKPVLPKEAYRIKYRYTYAYQEGTWVPQGREIKDSDGWKDCKGNLLDIGCRISEKEQAGGEKPSK